MWIAASLFGNIMQTDNSSRFVWALFLLAIVWGVVPVSLLAKDRPPSDSRGSYYYQAYDQGFRAGQADYRAGRPYGYHVALVSTAGVASISSDYRNAFKLGYQDGYAGHNHGSDWYYRHHRHDSDCDEDDDRGEDKWGCRDRHDNGKHKGWYKHHHTRHEDEDADDDD